MPSVVFGCGDVGRRIVKYLVQNGASLDSIHAYVSSVDSAELCARLGVIAQRVDLDNLTRDLSLCEGREIYYTVPPQKTGTADERSQTLTSVLSVSEIKPKKVVVISTTGVYGDHDGEWVDETTPTTPQTDRGKRRLDSEQTWLAWGKSEKVPVVILRVPGIYAYSRLPVERLKKRTPVVKAQECGYTNRIHADDLAMVCVVAMYHAGAGEIFNVTDGTPGKISEYLQTASHVLGMEPLPEISMDEAPELLSEGMLSYLRESRKISNKKMLSQLPVELKFPSLKQGIKV